MISGIDLWQHRDQDFEFIITGIVGILEQQMISVNKLLPGAKKALPYITETSMSFFSFSRVKS
jgi:hypothetical protein